MKMKLPILSVSLFTFFSFLFSYPTRAQQSVDLIMDNFTSSVLTQSYALINGAAVEASMRNANKRSSSGKAAAARNINLAYTPSKQLQQKTVKELGDKLTASSPAAGKAFNDALGTGKADYSALFSQMVQESGLPANNAATALAAYLEIGYMIVNNVQGAGIITPNMDRALQRQAASLLKENSRLSSPALVAKLGEETKLQSVVLYLGWQSALKTPLYNQFRANVAKQFKGLGLDLARVQLTNHGFAAKK